MNYYYSLVVSQRDSEPILQEFNHMDDALEFARTFLECSPDVIKEPVVTIVRRREEDR